MHVIAPTRTKYKRQITDKQRRYIEIMSDPIDPPKTMTAGMERAGYKSVVSLESRSGLQRKEVQDEIARLRREKEKRIAVKVSEDMEAVKADPKEFIGRRLLEHAQDPEITPNQTHAIELVGKLHGTFVERIEIDAGEHFRSRFSQNLLEGGTVRTISANVSQETNEDTDDVS